LSDLNSASLYNTLKAFTEKDPDGNGKDDTFGMIYVDDPSYWSGFTAIELALGGVNGKPGGKKQIKET
jgi:putative aldouronate transport system substrate-binding protein